MHYSKRKAKMDQNTRDRMNRHRREKPGQLYEKLINERIKQEKKLIDYINKMKPDKIK